MKTPKGWPTEEMMKEGLDTYLRATKNLELSMGDAFRAMLAAAPTPPAQEWCEHCGCGSDQHGFAHTPLCPTQKTPPAQEVDANVCTSTSPDAHKTGNIDDKQEINYALISK